MMETQQVSVYLRIFLFVRHVDWVLIYLERQESSLIKASAMSGWVV